MNILHFNSLPSTYTYVCENASTMASDTVILADFQTSGRGQRGNTWESEAGSNLLMSMLVRMNLRGREPRGGRGIASYCRCGGAG